MDLFSHPLHADNIVSSLRRNFKLTQDAVAESVYGDLINTHQRLRSSQSVASSSHLASSYTTSAPEAAMCIAMQSTTKAFGPGEFTTRRTEDAHVTTSRRLLKTISAPEAATPVDTTYFEPGVRAMKLNALGTSSSSILRRDPTKKVNFVVTAATCRTR